MAPRVDSELLLVGSLPADSTEAALRAGAEFFGDLVFALPDGETGPRVGLGRLRARAPGPAQPWTWRWSRIPIADRAPAARVRDPGVRSARVSPSCVGIVAADRRRDRVLPVFRGCARGRDPGRCPLPGRPAVPGQRA